jgi:hypothetical protein
VSLPIRGRDQNLQLVNINDSQDLFLVRLGGSSHPGEIRLLPRAETIRSIPTDNQITALTFLLPVPNHRLFQPPNAPIGFSGTEAANFISAKSRTLATNSTPRADQTCNAIRIYFLHVWPIQIGSRTFALCNDISDMPLIKCECDVVVIRRLK